MDPHRLSTTVDLHNAEYIAHSRSAVVVSGEGAQQVGIRLGMSLTKAPEGLSDDDRRAIQEAFSHAVVSRLCRYYPGLLTCEGGDTAPAFPEVDWKGLKESGGAVSLEDADFKSKVDKCTLAWTEDDLYSLTLVDKGSNGESSARIKFLFDWNKGEAKVSMESIGTKQMSQIVWSVASWFGALGAGATAASATSEPIKAAGAAVATVLGAAFIIQTAAMLCPGHESFSSSGSLSGVSDRARTQIDSLFRPA